MSTTTADTIAAEYPIPTYRFVVSLGDEKVSFKSVSGLDIKYESIEYKDGTGGIFRMPGQLQVSNITLSKGVFKGKNALHDWLSTISLNAVEKRDLMISLTDETGSELLASWSVVNAFPTGLTAPSFDATSNDIAVQEISLTADRVTFIAH
ncbi:conserved hypothetical phage tail region protein [Shewanella psychrophila]|uniref:Conserved hypothetical phage tail region protein n=1 Tax=Shewanella psychrophila TaxID=225848 RepID=A0A1S6HM96_9GAMM|nr:phage tail protein [Shewanella psychrophila]AQS36647.1 conserved hypothetical phage tail region protein [Shewanella psychrophila]